MSTADGRRQLTLSLNPWGGGDLDTPLAALLTAAFGDPAAVQARSAVRPRFLDRSPLRYGE